MNDTDVSDSLSSACSAIASDNFTPCLDSALRFLSTDVTSVKVIILGMDPYPQIGRATGRAFEDGGISSWSCLRNNPSLGNIIKLLYSNKTGNGICELNVVRDALDTGNLIAGPIDLFDSWEAQGVLLLNVGLTCEVGTPGSHIEIWRDFTSKCFSFLARKNRDITWLLWGRDAQESAPDGVTYFSSTHPRDNSTGAGSFLAENHFSRISDINWTGI
jgi:uracil-DNA glycosylase